MADFIEEYFTKTAKRFERFLARKWRKPIGLASILAIVTFCFYFEIERLIPSFEANKNAWLLVALLLDTTVVWAYYKYRNKLIVNKPKFGILIHADNKNREEVDRILLPLLDDLKEEIDEFKFIGISSSPFQTVAGAETFLKNNDDGLTQVLFIKATIGQDAGINKFLVQEAVLCTHGIPLECHIFGERISIKDEVAFRTQNDWGFSIADELYGASTLRGNLKDIVYYYLGLSSVCTENPELGLRILKRLFKPSDHLVESEIIGDKLRIKLNKRFYQSSRLARILSLLCRLNFDKYHKEGRNPHSVIAFLKEYVELLEGHTDAFEIYVSLARYSYDVGNFDDARLYTYRMEAIRPASHLVHLNNGFFGMIDRSVPTVVNNYKFLCKYIEDKKKANKKVDYNSEDVIVFLQRQEAANPSSITLLRYGVAIQKLYFENSTKGIEMLNDLNGRTENVAKYRVLNLHVKSLLKKQTKRIIARR